MCQCQLRGRTQRQYGRILSLHNKAKIISSHKIRSKLSQQKHYESQMQTDGVGKRKTYPHSIRSAWLQILWDGKSGSLSRTPPFLKPRSLCSPWGRVYLPQHYEPSVTCPAPCVNLQGQPCDHSTPVSPELTLTNPDHPSQTLFCC